MSSFCVTLAVPNVSSSHPGLEYSLRSRLPSSIRRGPLKGHESMRVCVQDLPAPVSSLNLTLSKTVGKDVARYFSRNASYHSLSKSCQNSASE